MKQKTGRPKSENPKNTIIAIRLDADDIAKLDKCCEILKVSKSILLRDLIDKVYADLEQNK